jgi:metallo-beta-lactamase family protein
MFQGPEEHLNRAPFGFDARGIDGVVVTHAHLDHIGRLPLLFRDGYEGRVYATDPTAELMPLMLEDALKVMREDRRRALRHGKDAPDLPWSDADLDRLVDRLVPVPYYAPVDLGPLAVELKNAAHLPGSAFVELAAGGERVVFSGDLGNQRKEILPGVDFPSPSALVVCEATYGDRSHRSFQATLDELASVMRSTLAAGGKVLIPSFALERTQELLFHLREFEERGRVPVAPVFLDSPLAIKVTQAYESMTGAFGTEVRQLVEGGAAPFRTADLRFVERVADSKEINSFEGAATIIAGAGMLSGGRIVHHLRAHLPDRRNCLVIVGFQPRGGLGRALVDGANPVRIHGRQVAVGATVHTLGGFSGHADQDELLDWLEEQPKVALVHGEEGGLEGLRDALRERDQQAIVAEHGKPITTHG